MRLRLARLAFATLEIAFTLVFLSAVAHHVGSLDFKPLAAMTVPLVVVFYGFASVLFVRGRALVPGPWQTRSLYAAEKAMQATAWYLLGLVLGVIVYALLKRVGIAADTRLLAFVVPYAFMQLGLIFFMRALWAIAPDVFGAAGMLAMARRVSAPRGTAGA